MAQGLTNAYVSIGSPRTRSNITIPKDTRMIPLAIELNVNHRANFQWIACTHPEGSLYFLAESSQCLKIFTDEDVTNPTTRGLIEKAIDKLLRLAQRESISVVGTEIVLELKGKNQIGYYFVQSSSRSIFWLEDFDISEVVLLSLDGVTSLPQARTASLLRHNFGWFIIDFVLSLNTHLDGSRYHCGCFPDSNRVFALGNFMVELEYYVVYALGAILMRTFVTSKFLDFHGRVGARLSADQSVYMQEIRTLSGGFILLLFVMLSKVFFNAPAQYLSRFKEIMRDDQVSRVYLQIFIDRLNSDWKDVVLYSTVVLNANVAFLAVPGVVRGPDFNVSTTAQKCSFASLLLSICSVTVGLFLIRTDYFKLERENPKGGKFMKAINVRSLGILAASVVFGLPYTLLVWGMLFFTVAVLSSIFPDQSTIIIGCIPIAFITIWLMLEKDPTLEEDGGNSSKATSALEIV
ncbi:hypothetical protein M422DRAFT_274155 [Sphaerobolus stellatus SS14]|uniref:Uncharacterized protein n=1 Tax=Sphaerobolus stellatus (strain SS14) TaxID=990650 RepID=A0A0C9UHV1_SPHS4|nr:hypothetical protein M422DRAFT_274155 [Sphaerobolus stellatus SS14]